MSSNKLHDFFGPDEDSCNLGAETGAGRPGVGLMARAISAWAAQNGGVTIGDAAKTFNMPPEAVAQCVDHHPYLMVLGRLDDVPLEERVIEHDGE